MNHLFNRKAFSQGVPYMLSSFIKWKEIDASEDILL